MEYLIRHIKDSTNHTFNEVIKPRENESYEIVSAESKEEAEEMVKESIQCPRCKSQNVYYEYHYGDIDEPSYIYTICNNCMGVCLEETGKDSE